MPTAYPCLPLVQSDEERELRRTVRSIASKYGHAYWVSVSRSGGNPTELWRDLGAAGLLGVAVPEEHGGGGGTFTDLISVTEELAACGLPLPLLVISPSVCATVLAASGTPEQKAEWLPGLASGEKVMCFALTEPDAGLNTHALRTRAVGRGGGWRIDGAKHYISHVDRSDAVLVVARTGEPDARGRGALSLFIVDVDAPGLSRSEVPVETLEPDRQFTLTFDAVDVDGTALVGTVDAGLAGLFPGLNPERIGCAALLNGVARYALEKASRYAREREVWGVPIGTHQGVAHPLAKAWVELQASLLMTARAAALHDAGLPGGSAANVAKLMAAEAAEHALDAAVQTHGGNGMATEYGLSTLTGLVRLFRIVPLTTEMVLNHIAQHELGLPKSY